MTDLEDMDNDPPLTKEELMQELADLLPPGTPVIDLSLEGGLDRLTEEILKLKKKSQERD